MKKIIIPFILALCLLFSGCSCAGETYLEFSSAWGGTSTGYSETLVYDVEYKSDYAGDGKSYTIDESIKDLNSQIVGTYVVNTRILSAVDSSIPENVKQSEVFKNNPSTVIAIKTMLSLSATYAYGQAVENSLDTIETETYICSFDYALAPIYSESNFDYGIIRINEGLTVERLKGKNTAIYQGSSYKTATIIDDESGEKTVSENEEDYTLKTLIDSNQLLFAIRNLKLDLEQTKVIPTVHPTYNEAKEISVSRFCDSERTVNLNGESKVFKVSGISYRLNSVDAAGYEQLVFVQNTAVDGVENKALIVSYVEPLVEYAAYKMTGAMVYSLKTISIA